MSYNGYWEVMSGAAGRSPHPTKGVRSVQQMTPPQGRLFPDPPEQNQQSAPRFSSSNTHAYEPQLRMQQSGRLPVYNPSQYTTGSLQALHGTQPVQSMPPLSAMPTAQAYQAQQQSAQQSAQQGSPVIVQTMQGVPVLVSLEELKKALGEMESKEEKEQKGKQKSKQEKRSRSLSVKFSVMWVVFGLIGIGTVLVQTARYVVIPLLVHFF